MTETQFTSGGSGTVPRDRWGRPLVVGLDGVQVAYTRATTIAGALDDLYGLMGWKQRQTAVGLAARKDLLLRAASLGPQPVDEEEKKAWKARMDEVCEAAMEASASSAAATIGTALHTYTEAIDTDRQRGRVWSGVVPTEYQPHLESYREATASLAIEQIETFLVNDDILVGGTADRLVRHPVVPGLIVGDVKTGNIDYPHKMAMQLAIYAHSQSYDPATGARAPIPDLNTDVGLIIGLDARTGVCTPFWIDIASGWQAVQMALKVREWRGKKNLTQPYDAVVQEPLPVSPPAIKPAASVAGMSTEAVAAALFAAIMAAAHQGELMELAQAAQAAGYWTDQHNEAAAARWPSLPPW